MNDDVAARPKSSAVPPPTQATGPAGHGFPPHPVEVAVQEAGLQVGGAGRTFWDDPYPYFHALRAHDPVFWSERLGRWVLTGYAENETALRGGHWHSNRVPNAIRLRSEAMREELRPLMTVVSKQMAFTDPPDHTRLRSLVNKAFMNRSVERLRPRIHQIADELIDRAGPSGEMDVIRDFADLLPAAVILEILGLPPEEHDMFKRWSIQLTEFIANPNPGEASDRRSQDSVIEALDYFGRKAEEVRAHPRDDLLSALVLAEEHGDRLSMEELLANAAFVLIAGHETTTNLIGNGLLALLRHPDQMQRLLDDPGLIASATEELLRYDSPIQLVGRAPTDDVTIGDKRVETGSGVMFVIGAANRDPLTFPDPDRLDITRANNRHIAFGGGIHFCLGAALARVEGQVAISSLLARCPGIGLSAETVSWRPIAAVRTLTALPVRWNVAR